MPSKYTKKLEFLGTEKVIDADPQLTVLENAIANKIPLNHSCEGMGTCGTCRVIVVSGLESMKDPNEIEKEMIGSRGFSSSERLACQNLCSHDLVLKIPNED